MKKTIYAVFGLMSLTLVGAVTVAIAHSSASNRFLTGTGPEYTMTLDASNAPADLVEGTYSKTCEAEAIIENGDYTLTMNYRLAQNESGYHVLLAPHGYMYNQVDYSDYESRILGLNSITVNYTSTANVSIRTSIRNDGKELSNPAEAQNGVPVTFEHQPYYFMIEAGDAAAHIESVVLKYSCQENTGYDLYSLSGTYSGLGSDSKRYKLTINNSSVNVKSLDNNTVDFSGTVALAGSTLTSTLDVMGNPGEYVTSVSSDHRVLTFVSKSGAAASFPSIDFYKVYSVEDFEEYTAQGNAFGGSGRGADSLYDMSGLRGAYHCDWYTTSSSYAVSYIEDSGWKVMGSTDFLTYTSNKGYESSKAAAFKGNSNGLRYIQFKGMHGLPQIIGKGSYLSFYAKAYTNSTLTTVKTTDTPVKVYGFFDKQITKSNVGSIRTAVDITIPANSDWARYTIALNPDKNYYSYGFYLNGSATVYLAVDNVEIYTVDPHLPTAVTGVSVSPASLNLSTGDTGQLTATVSPVDATNKTVTWSSSDASVASVNNNGLVTAHTAGSATITATTADGGFTATSSVTVTGAAVAPYPSGSYKANAVVLSANYQIVLAFGTRANGLIGVRLSNSDAVATGITYDDATQNFTITTTGDFNGYTYGNITGHYDDANDKITNIACDGSVSAGVSSISDATLLDVWDCDGTTSELQSLFKRRYMSGSWQVDTGNADRITSNTTEFVSGTGSVKRRGYSGGAVALNFNADFSPAKTVKNVQFWVYNPSASNITLRMWGYKATNFGSNFETGTVTAKAGQWTYVAMGFTEASVYNWQIADFNNTGVYLSFDNIALF